MVKKKKYIKPSMEVYKMDMNHQLLQYSGGDAGYLPTIPGMPEDEKKLA